MAGKYSGKISTRRTRTYDTSSDEVILDAIEADMDTKADIASPHLTGVPTAPTAPNGTDTDQIATTAFVLANAAGGIWGGIDGELADQVDLQAALDEKAPLGHAHSYNDLEDLPALGTAAAASAGDFATAAQGALADTALQPGDLGLSGVATITLPGWRRSHTQTIAAPGVTALNRIIASLGAMGPTDQNTAELLEIAALSAVAGADTITFTAAFAAPASGPIPLNWSAF